METRTERWKEYRLKMQEDGTYGLSVNQRDLLALDAAKEAMVTKTYDPEEYLRIMIRNFKVARKIVDDIEVEDANK